VFRDRAVLVSVLLLTVLAYLPLAGADFAWDDVALVADNKYTSSFEHWRELITADLWLTTRLPAPASGYYRPLLLLDLTLDQTLFGLDPAAHHVHSVLWHLFAVGGLWTLLRRLLPGATVAVALGTVIFALHPLQIEAVALIAARNDSMAAALGLFALVMLERRAPSPPRLAAGAVLAWLALLSKESAVLLPFFLLSLDLARHRRPLGWARYAALVTSLVAYLGCRVAAGVGRAAVPSMSSIEAVADKVLHIASVYAGLVVWPWPLTPARHISYLPPLGASLFGLVVLLGIVTWLVRQERARGLVLAGLAWAALSFAPTLLATLDKGLMGERYLYLPLAGLAVAVAAAVPATLRLQHVALLALVGSIGVRERVGDWASSLTLWEAAHADAPSAFTHAGLAHYLRVQAKDPERARAHYIGALEGDPPYTDACSSLILVHLQLGQPERALHYGLWALEERGCQPTADVLEHLALAYAQLGRWDEAEAAALKTGRGAFAHEMVVLGACASRRADWEAVSRLQAAYPGEQYIERVIALLARTDDPAGDALAALAQRASSASGSKSASGN